MLIQSQSSVEVEYFKKVKISDATYHLYVLPIQFGEDWLGYVGLLSTNKLLKLFRSFLAGFEDTCIDDQVVHVLGFKEAVPTVVEGS